VSFTRILGLDGLRAISILAVVVGHVVDTKNGPLFLGPLRHAGNFGVRVFFVISGFLITTLLLKELSKTGTISILGFYKRRSFRILPAFLVYVAAIYLLNVAGLVALKSGDLFHTLTFTMNYHQQREWALNHLWSLSVEQQFYLLWPLLILFAGFRASGLVCLSAVLGAIVIRYLMLTHFAASDSQLTREFQAVVDAMATGALISIYSEKLETLSWFKQLISSPMSLLISAVILLASWAIGVVHKPSFYIYGQTAANLAIGILVIYTVSNSNSAWTRLMETRILSVIGVSSFSLYLWQEVFLSNSSNQWFAAFPQNLFLTFIAGYLSYKLVELPFIRMYRSK
jgi:peptidoglycan/LPS O-acetylase OafA/YrhL